ncbi:hypothetical protein [Arundinibacter roseus]|uniref:Uncharacterized protein n=1 Tax=Arundinibacter roseus TaxID=2070510 RepID=A0A4R4KDZ8_9BACT|nr:hypothetical protein [Arundinibacter roseus]TDB64659.1 hypothetical protein EZE20_13410 [Arundinibacter roseus]
MRLLDHEFFETLEYEQKFDGSGFEKLLFTIKNVPQPTTLEELKRLTINLMDCQRAIYASLLFHFDPDDLAEIKDLPGSTAEIISQFDEAVDEVLKKHIGN